MTVLDLVVYTDFIDDRRHTTLPHGEFIQQLDKSLDEIEQKYGFTKKSRKVAPLKAKFSALDQDFKKLLHRDAKFAKIYQNEEKYERELLGNKYVSKKMRMSIEDREFEVYKKYANWVSSVPTTLSRNS